MLNSGRPSRYASLSNRDPRSSCTSILKQRVVILVLGWNDQMLLDVGLLQDPVLDQFDIPDIPAITTWQDVCMPKFMLGDISGAEDTIRALTAFRPSSGESCNCPSTS